MLIACDLHATCMLLACYLHPTHMLLACYLQVTCVLLVCYLHDTRMLLARYLYTTCMQLACYWHATCMLVLFGLQKKMQLVCPALASCSYVLYLHLGCMSCHPPSHYQCILPHTNNAKLLLLLSLVFLVLVAHLGCMPCLGFLLLCLTTASCLYVLQSSRTHSGPTLVSSLYVLITLISNKRVGWCLR